MVIPAGVRAALKRYLFEGDMLRLMALTLLIKPVGLVTQMLTARSFGAGSQYDAYALTFFLVTFLDNLVGQSYNTVVLPLAIRMRDRFPREVVLRFQNIAALVFLLPVAAYMAILTLRSDWVLAALAPRLPDEARSWVHRMIPVMALPGVGLMVVTMGKAVLNANRRYGVAGAMPLLGGVVMLAALALGAGPLGIWCLPLGFVLSAVLQLGVTFGFALRTGCVAAVRPAAPPGEMRRLWDLGGLFLISQVVLLCGMASDRYFATGLEVGSVSSLAYTASIINMGTQLFSLSVAVVLFTRMAELIAAGEMARCGEMVRENLARQMRLVVPGCLALSLAAPEVVRVLFQRGAFDAADAARTTGVLAIYVLALPAMVANSLVARVFHALQRIRDRIWLHAVYVLGLVGGSLLLIGPLRVQGVAVAAVIATNVLVGLSFLALGGYRQGLGVRRIAGVMGRSYVFGAVVYLAYRLLSVDSLLAGWRETGAFWDAVLAGLGKAAFVFALYIGIHALYRRLGRPTRPSSPTAGGE